MKTSKYLVEGALLLAIYIVLLFISILVPFIGTISALLLPIPFIIYTYKYRFRNAVLMLLAAFILSFIFATVAGAMLTILFGTSGIVVGNLIRNKKSGMEILIGNTFSFLIPLLFIYIVAITLFDFNLGNMMTAATNESMEMIRNILQISGSQSELVLEQLEQSIATFPYLLPSLLLLTAFSLALFTQLVSYPILKRLKVTIERLPSFKDVMLPKSLLWLYLVVMIISFIEVEPGSFFYMAVLNLFYILQLLMVLQGLSFIYFFSYKKKIPVMIPIIITILSPFLLYIIRILGIIDLGFDLRNRIKSKS